MGHCPPPHHPEEPLGRATVSVLKAAEHPKGQQENRLSKSGSVLPGKRVGRNALLPVRAHWDSPGMQSGPLPRSCQASPGPGQSQARPLPPSQHSLGPRCSALSREGAAPAPHSGVRRDFARSCCSRWRKPFNSIPCPRIHQPGSRDEARKRRESAELRSTVLGAVCSPGLLRGWKSVLEISAGLSPRQTAPGALHPHGGRTPNPCSCRGELALRETFLVPGKGSWGLGQLPTTPSS